MYSGNIEKKTKVKIYIVLFFFVIGFGAVWKKIFNIQILEHGKFLNLANRQYYRTLSPMPERGTIYDRKGRELAVSVEADSIYANPFEIEDTYKAANIISQVLKVDSSRLIREFNKERGFVWVKRKVTPDEAESVESLNLKGIGFIKEGKRFYPKKELAGRMLGFVGIDNHGLSGVEYSYDEKLMINPDRIVIEKDAFGRGVNFADDYEKSIERGYDLRLTIDEVIQYITEKELASQVSRYKAKGGTAIVMDPYTGEILSMADQPQFNPNSFSQYREREWRNRGVTDSFEPGSTFKLILTAAAIEEKIASQNDIFFCENGEYEVAGKVIHEAKDHKYKWLTLKEIIGKSSNIGVIKVAERLGAKNFYDYILKFGIGSKTNINLPGESAGKVRSLQEWSGVSLASMSFGQEVSVTSIQLVSAVSAIANGGILMKPYVMKAVEKDGMTADEFKPEVVRRVISEKTSRELTEILEYAVRYGTGQKAMLEGYDVAGKTGTAQKASPDKKGYSDDKFLSSFIGYAPSKNPRLVILVIIDEPEDIAWGGEVAAPVFREIARQSLRYLKVPAVNGI
jgi:cell division protein FtsI (penicillin-binding protein 3)